MTLQEHFSTITDFRQSYKVAHKLTDILVLTVISSVCGCTEYKQIELFGKSHLAFLQQFLELKNGIPSHDTVERILKSIHPNEFHTCFTNWTQHLFKSSKGDLIAIDGKTSRRSFSKTKQQSPIHLVNAWSTRNGLVLGQYKVDSKSNEITALPELLKLLDVEGAIISIDAMGCQTELAKAIIIAKADYILALKGNQKTLYDEAVNLFKHVAAYSTDESIDATGGRIVTRKCTVINDLKFLDEKAHWTNLSSVIRVEAYRESGGKKQLETRYYISSLVKSASDFNILIRAHWQIENNLHWQLDITFREDESRKREGYSAENSSLVSKFAMNILKTSTNDKLSFKNKQLNALLNEEYLLNIIKASCV